MKKCINGKYAEMTEEEVKRFTEEASPPLEPTMDERVKELEEALELLLSGVTSDEI